MEKSKEKKCYGIRKRKLHAWWLLLDILHLRQLTSGMFFFVLKLKGLHVQQNNPL